MSRIADAIGASILLLGAGLSAATDATFSGEIIDSACAKEGSHEAMMKKAGLTDKGACARACVKMGGKYVLFNALPRRSTNSTTRPSRRSSRART